VNEHSFIFVSMRPRDENKEAAIRQKAIQMIVKDGFDGLSMQKLAKAAGVSPATIYIYYKDRDDLVFQLALRESKRMTESTLRDFDPEMSFAEGLKIQWRNRSEFCLANPDTMYFLESIRHSPFSEKSLKHMDEHFVKAMKAFTYNAIQRKELIEMPIEVYWSIAFAPLYNLIRFHLTGKSLRNTKFTLTDDTLQKTLQLVVKALTP